MKGNAMRQVTKHTFESADGKLLVDNTCYVECHFKWVDAGGAYVASSLFVNCHFDRVDLYWCNGFEGRFVDCRFDFCDLRGSFEGAAFVRCHFRERDWGPNALGGETVWWDAT
jgi:hypothetical protein